jgi:coenzyme F420 hydrogenase subunit beta
MAMVQYMENGHIKSAELTYEQSWGDILQKYRQWRCYICPDHIGEYADIAVADAWHRSVAENQPGRSVMITRTVRGGRFFEQAMGSGFIQGEEVSHETLPACRPGQAGYQGGLWARVQTLKLMRVSSPNHSRFALFRLWISELTMWQKMHSVLSTIKRVFVKKLYVCREMRPEAHPYPMGEIGADHGA